MSRRKRRRYLHDMRWPPAAAGRPVRQDELLPTAELTMQRLRASGRPDIPDDFPLDVLEAREMITPRQAQAGRYLAAARYRLFGRPPGSVEALYKRMVAGFGHDDPVKPPSEDDIEDYQRWVDDYQKRRELYIAAVAVLKAQGQMALNTTMRVAVYLERPRWLQAAIDRKAVGALAAAEHEALLKGLGALADHYRLPTEPAAVRKSDAA